MESGALPDILVVRKVAAKIALGYTLDETEERYITGKTYASFEPMLDYCVVKILRLPFDKFITAKRTRRTDDNRRGCGGVSGDNLRVLLMKAIRSLSSM